jgi:hypothetical protein
VLLLLLLLAAWPGCLLPAVEALSARGAAGTSGLGGAEMLRWRVAACAAVSLRPNGGAPAGSPPSLLPGARESAGSALVKETRPVAVSPPLPEESSPGVGA